MRPLVPRINCYSLDKTSTLYTYDPWTDASTTGRPVYCSVNLSQNTWGTFTFQVEGTGFSPSFTVGDRVVIECGKQSTQMTRLISGVIRQRGATRGADGKKLLTYSGSSTGIRLNERVTYQVRTPAVLAQDGITPDITDPNMVASTLLQNSIALGTYPTTEVIDTNQITSISDVVNFVGGLSVEYGELQDVVSSVEEQSGGEVNVDANDVVIFRHDLSQYPPASGKGFTIKNKKTANDNADDTCYLRGKNWDYTESIYKSNNYSNDLYGILPAEAEPTDNAASGGSVGGIQSNVNSVAQKFRPPHSHFLPGDLFIAGQSHTNTTVGAFGPTLAIAGPDVSNTPNNLPIIVWMIPQTEDLSANASGQIGIRQDTFWLDVTGVVSTTGSLSFDTSKDYWLVNTSYQNSTSGTGRYFKWFYRSTGTGTISLHAFPDGLNVGVNSTLGTGWAAPSTGLMWFAMPRRRSQAFRVWDSKAIVALGDGTTSGGYITSTLSNIPSYVKNKEAMYKYLTTQLYNMCRPQAVYNTATVTAPNVPILPGDPIMISDSVMGFSASGSTAVMTVCGDMNYSWGSPGGQGMTYQAPTILSIQPVGAVPRYE